MPEYEIGPCECCGVSEECCTPTSCHDLTVVIEGTDSALDGTYTAVWDGSNFWVFDVAGCAVEWYVSLSSGNMVVGNSVTTAHSFGPTPFVECEVVSGFSTMILSYFYNFMGNDFCGLGTSDLGGGTATVSWTCCFPEYFEITDGGADDNCTCSIATGVEIPIDCDAEITSPPNSLHWETLVPDCGFVSATYLCEGRTLTLNMTSPLIGFSQTYQATDVSFSDLNNPLVLSYAGGFPPCPLPAEITIQGHNCGNWCD